MRKRSFRLTVSSMVSGGTVAISCESQPTADPTFLNVWPLFALGPMRSDTAPYTGEWSLSRIWSMELYLRGSNGERPLVDVEHRLDVRGICLEQDTVGEAR